MRRTGYGRRLVALGAVLSLAGTTGLLPVTQWPAIQRASASTGTVLFSIPVGPEGVTYAGGGPEERQWGPAAIEAADDGSLWIADTAGNRILGYTRAGRRFSVIDLSGRATGVVDIASIGTRLALLDVAAVPPTVLTVDKDGGATVSVKELPKAASLATGLRGISADGNRKLYADIEKVSVPLDGNGPPLAGRPGKFGVAAIQMQARREGRRDATIAYRGKTFSLRVKDTLSGVYFGGDAADRSAFIVDETVTDSGGVLRVDRTVHLVSSKGVPMGLARVPIATSLYVQNGVTVAPTGEVIALVTGASGADVVLLQPSPSLSSILPPDQAVEPGPSDALAQTSDTSVTQAAVTACRSFLDMYNTANGYRYNSKSLTQTNISGTCGGRTKPRYLTTPKVYPSVSYDWDGFDTVVSWNSYMDQGKQAGNITKTATTNNCGKGVDCSGFVSRVWGRSSHVYTNNLDTISTTVSGGLHSMIPFDIFLKQGVHVIFFSGWLTDQELDFYVYESTTTNSWDRVMFHLVDAPYVAGFEMRRYNNRC